MSDSSANLSPWPHRIAVLMACATFPLIWVGGLVTTTQAGMAVPDWPNTYGYNLFLYPWRTWVFGPWDLFIEHGHRLLGALVGMIAIALVVAVWRSDHRRWMRGLSLAALLLVCLQGALGGMRVLLDERTLAQIHGCVGPAFFAFSVALAVFTSQRWRSSTPPERVATGPRLHRLALITAALAYGQLVLGSMLRHIPVDASPSTFRSAVLMHLLLAAALLWHGAALVLRVMRNHRGQVALRRPTWILTGLLVAQCGLGAGTWVMKYGWPDWIADTAWTAGYTISASSFGQSMVVTAHMATGSLILAMAVLITLRAFRLVEGEPRSARASTFLAGVAA